MTLRGLKIKWAYYCVNKRFAGTKSKHFEKKRMLLNSIGHEIGEGTKIVGPVDCTGKLIAGKNCWIGKNLTINGNGTVVIGDNCDLAPEVVFQTGGHETGTHERRAGRGFNKDITVGNGCWIGGRSTILGGVRIGDGCIVAACACVNKNVGDDNLVGGVPAGVIKELPHDKTIT